MATEKIGKQFDGIYCQACGGSMTSKEVKNGTICKDCSKDVDEIKSRKVIQEFNAKRWKDGTVEIYDLNSFGENEENLKLGINWCASGTVSIEKAKKHIEEIKEAIQIIEKTHKKKLTYGDYSKGRA